MSLRRRRCLGRFWLWASVGVHGDVRHVLLRGRDRVAAVGAGIGLLAARSRLASPRDPGDRRRHGRARPGRRARQRLAARCRTAGRARPGVVQHAARSGAADGLARPRRAPHDGAERRDRHHRDPARARAARARGAVAGRPQREAAGAITGAGLALFAVGAPLPGISLTLAGAMLMLALGLRRRRLAAAVSA